MKPFEELQIAARRLGEAADAANHVDYTGPVTRMRSAIDSVGLAASGSWLGYQANVYYTELEPPPPGAHFSSEWGLEELYSNLGTRGNWKEYEPGTVKAHLRRLAAEPDFTVPLRIAGSALSTFEREKAESLSILEVELVTNPDSHLSKLKAELEDLKGSSKVEIIRHLGPRGPLTTRDLIAGGQGLWTPPHILELVECTSLDLSVSLCRQAGAVLARASSYMERKQRQSPRNMTVGANVFIGHGRSSAWRELKDFVGERLRLRWDEFNRVPVAGRTNIARLSEMLDAAAIAFLVMTGEDELADGGTQARMNVIHEAGLFQGRLGFKRAIILLEEGCSEFSNIQGLVQIRFPLGRIDSVFEHVRQVLEREGIIPNP